MYDVCAMSHQPISAVTDLYSVYLASLTVNRIDITLCDLYHRPFVGKYSQVHGAVVVDQPEGKLRVLLDVSPYAAAGLHKSPSRGLHMQGAFSCSRRGRIFVEAPPCWETTQPC